MMCFHGDISPFLYLMWLYLVPEIPDLVTVSASSNLIKVSYNDHGVDLSCEKARAENPPNPGVRV
jgi:hypothetical protein